MRPNAGIVACNTAASPELMYCSPQNIKPKFNAIEMHPTHASFNQSRTLLGKGRRHTKTIAQRITDANRKRSPAKVNGGRSRNPILMKIQVEPQIRQRMSQTIRGMFIAQVAGCLFFRDQVKAEQATGDAGRAPQR